MADPVDSTTSTKKKTRSATSCQELTSRRPTGYRYPIEFDGETGQPKGKYATKFKTFVAMLARNKVSILVNEWENVDDGTKECIWQDVTETFDVDPNNKGLKKRWLSYAANRWKSHKTMLTRTYVFGPGDKDGCKTPCYKYKSISEETWELFVKSRHEPEFLEKRAKGKQNQAKNKYYHRTSRGGYAYLKATWKENRLKEMQKESDNMQLTMDDVDSPPRHEQWKLARIKSTGEYINDETSTVASKIDDLVDQATQGTFVPDTRMDILTTAIGIPDHGGRPRVAPFGVGLKTYYGSAAPRGKAKAYAEMESFKAVMMQQFEETFNKRVDKAVAERLASQGCVTQPAAINMQELQETISQRIEKTVAERLANMACASQPSSGQPNPMKTPMRESAKDSCSPSQPGMPTPTNWLRELSAMLYDFAGKAQGLLMDYDPKSVEHYWIGEKEITDITMGGRWLELCHLALWGSYCWRLCKDRGYDDRYGIFSPYQFGSLCPKSSPKKLEEIQAYIQNKMTEEKRQCYLAPYCYSGHWQLAVVCPEDHVVVWLCSLGYRPNQTIVQRVNNAIDGYNRIKGVRRNNPPEWLLPKVARQTDGWACGIYVMRNMMTIISAGIVGNWMEVFNDTSSMSNDELLSIRQIWAEYFCKFYTDLKIEPKRKKNRKNGGKNK